ncbi:MAG: DUF6682 family protein [Desulfohalobiaceae bacterium]
MQAKDIYALVSQRLQDMQEPRRWPWEDAGDTEVSLQRFLNNALLLVALQRPDSTSVIKPFTLQTGALQELGSDDLFLLECPYLLDDDDKPKRSLTRIDRQDLESHRNSWFSEDGDIWHWAYERTENAKHFWVVSGAKDGQKVQTIMSERPDKVADPTDELQISATYQPALAEAVLYQIFASDTSDTNYQKAMHALENFAQVLNIKLNADLFAPVGSRRRQPPEED